MKFMKYLISLAVIGALALSFQSAQAAEHTFTWGGALRVESLVTSVNSNVTVDTLDTKFGGSEEESSTGGDTHLQLSYGYASDDGSTTGSGFIRFSSDRVIRINVAANSESDTYAASMKAEWEQLGWVGADGTGGVSRTERDQFATLTHKGSSVYFKIGREEWLGNEKGYVTDFLSASKGYAGSIGAGNRFSGHKLGWSSSDLGLDVGLFLQRDHSTGARKLLGVGNDLGDRTGDINAAGLMVNYASGPVDVEFITLSGTLETNPDRFEGDYKQEVAVTEVHLAVPLGTFTPFFNLGMSAETVNSAEEKTSGGNNLGVAYSFGFADLVVAFGSASSEDPNADTETSSSGFDLMFATNQDPLRVSLAFTSGSVESTPAQGDAETVDTGIYGVRFDYGF